MIIGVDHGYSVMKTAHICFPSGIVRYEHEPYTNRGVLKIEGKYYVCGTGRQPLLRTKTENEQYYLLTLAAIAQEIRFRKAPRKAEVVLAAGLPLTSFGREKKNFRDYLLERKNPVVFEYEGEIYEIRVLDVRLFPQGYSVVAMHPEIIRDEPSVLLVDIGGWTIDIMRLDNGVPNAATCRSLEMGVIRCQDEILEQVRRDTGLSITEVHPILSEMNVRNSSGVPFVKPALFTKYHCWRPQCRRNRCSVSRSSVMVEYPASRTSPFSCRVWARVRS